VSRAVAVFAFIAAAFVVAAPLATSVRHIVRQRAAMQAIQAERTDGATDWCHHDWQDKAEQECK
jgi:hypothetical protein